MTNDNRSMAGIYMHVPFCIKKCRYCDFFSVADPGRMDSYVQALLREMALVEQPEQRADTLYLGGGTPSLLSPGDLDRVIDTAGRRLGLVPGSEITLEVNPGTVDPAKLKALRRCGVNRLNIGVQSFDDGHLAFLGRIHSAREAKDCIVAARDAGFDNIGLDLIYGLPGQSNADWERDLGLAVAAMPDHLSCYMLTYEPDTPLGLDRQTGRVRPLGEGRVRVLFEITRTFLAAAGYRQYEISNFARSKGCRSRHNTKYWTLAPYTGLGPSAHSFCLPERWWNFSDLDAYLTAISRHFLPVASRETLTRDQQIIEAIYLGLRQTDGIDLKGFQASFDLDFREFFAPSLAALETEAMVEIDASRIFLTPVGMIYLDSVVGRLVQQAEG